MAPSTDPGFWLGFGSVRLSTLLSGAPDMVVACLNRPVETLGAKEEDERSRPTAGQFLTGLERARIKLIIFYKCSLLSRSVVILSNW